MRVSSPTALAQPGGHWQQFLERIVSLPEVESVEIDRNRGTAAIAFARQGTQLDELLERMAAALATRTVSPVDPEFLKLCRCLATRSRFRVHRRGDRLSIWEIVHESPGRLRVRDVDLHANPRSALRARAELESLTGVRDVAVGSFTGSIVIRYDAAAIDRDRILVHLDRLTGAGEISSANQVPSRSQWMFANATLALSVAGAVVYPPLLPVSAVLLVASNIPNFHNAWRELRRRHVGLPFLHTTIVVATLATGGFVASSLMNWLLTYWEDRHARLKAAGHQLLADSVRRLQRAAAWVVREGIELETPVSALRPGDVISVRSGEVVPVDGRILAGTGLVEENSLRGTNGLVCCSVGDDLLEGAYLAEGELQIEVVRAGDATIATSIGRTLEASAAGGPSNGRAVPSEFAERAVPPSLATASLGFLVGDAAVATAVLRPDYATGPGIGGSATLIERLGACFDEGIVVRRPDVFHQMAQADLVLLDHDQSLSARILELEDVHVAGELSPDAILEYAECALRQFHDPRARAVAVAFAFQGGVPLQLIVHFRSGGVEFNDGSRRIRVDGFAAGRIADGTSAVLDRCVPLRVYVDDDLAGWLTFYEGAACGAASPVFDLRTRCGMQVELLTPDAEAAGLGEALGVDDVRICPSDAAKAQLIRAWRRQGRRVVYVGNCRQNPQAAAIANVAVFPCPDLTWEADPAGVWLLQPYYEKLVQLRDVARSVRHQEQLHFNLILIPNVVCVAGALLFGLTSLAVVVLSNLGTFSVYSRSRAALQRTQRRLRERRQRIPDQPRGDHANETSRQLVLRET